MSAQIVKMIDLCQTPDSMVPPLPDSFTPTRLKLLFKHMPSLVRCGWHTWQKIQGRRHLERYKGYYTWPYMYIYVYKHIIIIYNGIWNIQLLKSFRILPGFQFVQVFNRGHDIPLKTITEIGCLATFQRVRHIRHLWLVWPRFSELRMAPRMAEIRNKETFESCCVAIWASKQQIQCYIFSERPSTCRKLGKRLSPRVVDVSAVSYGLEATRRAYQLKLIECWYKKEMV